MTGQEMLGCTGGLAGALFGGLLGSRWGVLGGLGGTLAGVLGGGVLGWLACEGLDRLPRCEEQNAAGGRRAEVVLTVLVIVIALALVQGTAHLAARAIRWSRRRTPTAEHRPAPLPAPR